MGNFNAAFQSTNISQSQIQNINATCNQSVSTEISNVQITAIDSHLGDITLTASLVTGNIDCVLQDMLQSSASATADNAAKQAVTSLPFQANINNQLISQTTDIQSYQQSVINQSCNQSVSSKVDGVVLTFIDSTTGNIKIASTADIKTLSCNMTATGYQTATAVASNAASQTITNGCCAFDLGMLAPLLLGLVALIVVSKIAKKDPAQQAGGGGGGDSDDAGGAEAVKVEQSSALLAAALANGPRPVSSMA